MNLNELTKKLDKDLKELVSTEYVSKEMLIAIITKWSHKVETIDWGSKIDDTIKYAPKKYVASEILEELKKLCQMDL